MQIEPNETDGRQPKKSPFKEDTSLNSDAARDEGGEEEADALDSEAEQQRKEALTERD
jgi:hypothetical protein